MDNTGHTVFPSLLPEDEFVDDSYRREELERLDGNELQSIAAKHPSEEVNGHSKAKEIVEALEGEQRI